MAISPDPNLDRSSSAADPFSNRQSVLPSNSKPARSRTRPLVYAKRAADFFAAMAALSLTTLLGRSTSSGSNDVLNQKAARLYERLAKEAFGPNLIIEQAKLEDESVARLLVALPGLDLDHEIGNALKLVSRIHDRVEQIAPELVGRVIFDYHSAAYDRS